MSEEAVEPEARARKPAKPKPRRAPIDWAVVVMISGTLVFLMVFGAITALAPRRPILGVRFAQTAGRLTPTPVVVVPAAGAPGAVGASAGIPSTGAAAAPTTAPAPPPTPAGALPGVAGAPASKP